MLKNYFQAKMRDGKLLKGSDRDELDFFQHNR